MVQVFGVRCSEKVGGGKARAASGAPRSTALPASGRHAAAGRSTSSSDGLGVCHGRGRGGGDGGVRGVGKVVVLAPRRLRNLRGKAGRHKLVLCSSYRVRAHRVSQRPTATPKAPAPPASAARTLHSPPAAPPTHPPTQPHPPPPRRTPPPPPPAHHHHHTRPTPAPVSMTSRFMPEALRRLAMSRTSSRSWSCSRRKGRAGRAGQAGRVGQQSRGCKTLAQTFNGSIRLDIAQTWAPCRRAAGEPSPRAGGQAAADTETATTAAAAIAAAARLRGLGRVGGNGLWVVVGLG